MADTKISADPSATDLSGAVIPIVQGGANKQATPSLWFSAFRNAADSFTSIIRNLNTAARTYTFQDRDGTIADNTDLAGKQNALGFTPLAPANNLSDVANAQTALSNISYINKVRGATANKFHGVCDTYNSAITGAIAINVLRVSGWDLRFGGTIDKIQCEVTVGTTGNIRLVIYDDNGSGYPNNLVVDSGALAITAIGVYTATISVALKPGLYHVGYLTDTANTLRYWAGAYQNNPYGVLSTMGATSNNTYTVAQTYGAAPGTFPAGATFVNVGAPQILMRFV